MQASQSPCMRGAALQHCRPARPARSSRGLVVKAARVDGGPTLAIVGVTGAVGQEFLRVRHWGDAAGIRAAPASQLAAGPRPPPRMPHAVLLPLGAPSGPPDWRPPQPPRPAAPPPLAANCPAPLLPPPQVLKERDFPYSNIKMLASARSAGRKYSFDGQEYTVEELTEGRRVQGAGV